MESGNASSGTRGGYWSCVCLQPAVLSLTGLPRILIQSIFPKQHHCLLNMPLITKEFLP